MSYQHLTMEERYHIQAYKKAGYKNYEIAKSLKVHPSTISREIKRNSSSQRKSYSAKSANKVSNDRRMYASRKANKKMNTKIEKLIVKYINEDWSPEEVSATLRIKYNIEISYVRIYQLIKQNRAQGGNLYTHLRFYHTGHRRASMGLNTKVKFKIESLYLKDQK